MDEQKIKKIAQDEIASYMNSKQFNLSKIPSHTHTGLDAPKINENDLISAPVFTVNLAMGTAGSEVLTISRIPNLSLMTFYGIATNGAFGGGPYNQKATITGEVRITPVYTLAGNSLGTDFTPTSAVFSNYYQVCTSAYTDVTSVANQFVSANATAFAYVFNGTSEVARAEVTDVTATGVEITVTVTSSWYIQGSFFFS